MSRLLIALLLFSSPVFARMRVQGYCEQGGQAVVTAGIASTNKAKITYPNCTVTVYLAGTLTLSTIYADNAGTPKTNSFTADSNGYWFFYADDGQYDIRFSGTVPTPFTLGAVQVGDLSVINGNVATNTANIATNTANITSNTTAIATKANDSAVVHNTGNETINGDKTFAGNLFQDTETVLRPTEFAGVDMCAKVSAAYAFAIAQGWTSATVDARQRAWVGQQHCAGSPFAGVSNNGTFTGTFLTQGTQIVSDVPIVVPGGILWDGGGPRSFANPPRNFAGTAIQPSATYNWVNGPLVQLGSGTDTSSPQGVMVRRLAVGCLPPGGTYVAGVTPPAGATAILNANGQEMSGAEWLQFQDCPVSYDVEQISSGTPPHSGFDSYGLKHSTILVPYDPAAIGIACGSGLNGGLAGLAHVNGFDDNTITGSPNGVGGTAANPLAANGVGIDINCSDVSVRGNRFAYLNIPVRIGNVNSAQNVHVDVGDPTSNNSNAWSIIVDMEAHADHTETIQNILASGPGVVGGLILKDVNYPTGTCSLVQNNASTGDNGENSLTFYARGIGGGVNGAVYSTARTSPPVGIGCLPTGVFSALFSQNITWAGLHTFNQNLTVAATGTATSGANFPSKRTNYLVSVWNGTAAINCSMGWDVLPGTGTNPSTTMKLEICPTSASNNMDLSLLSPNGITFAPSTFKTNSAANSVQNGLNILTGTGVTATNISNANVQLNVSNPPATLSNCASAASPAVCGSAAAGVVTMPVGATLVTVNTTVVTIHSRISLTYDHSSSTNTELGVTCNTAAATENASYVLHDKVAGTSFTIHTNTAPATNPGCIQYSIID